MKWEGKGPETQTSVSPVLAGVSVRSPREYRSCRQCSAWCRIGMSSERLELRLHLRIAAPVQMWGSMRNKSRLRMRLALQHAPCHVEKPVTIVAKTFSCCGRTQIDCVDKSKITQSFLLCVSVPSGIDRRIAFQIWAIVIVFPSASWDWVYGHSLLGMRTQEACGVHGTQEP